MKFLARYFLTFCGCTVLPYVLMAQQKDTVCIERIYKNTIRVNITAPLIFTRRYMVIGYERLVGKNQSFSINVGTFGLPDFISASDSLNVAGANDNGAHISVDYRLYLARENRYRAPRGVYIGPYYSFNHLSRRNTWRFDAKNFNGDVHTTFDVDIHTIGLELGYQFIFWKRLAVDFVAVGPGMGHYSFKSTIDGSLNPEKRHELLTAMANRVKEKIPGFNSFFNEGQFTRHSGFSSWTIGYRYIIHIGYRF